MKKLVFALFTCVCIGAYAQSSPDKKFSPQQLKEDVAFLEKQLFDAHANPFTELNKQQYEQVFADIETKITDSLNATEFYKRIKPVFAYLSDEHAAISLTHNDIDETYQHLPIFLPFNLRKIGKDYYPSKSLPGLTGQDKIVEINNVPIDSIVKQCALFTTGYPDQRMQTALRDFSSLYTWSGPDPGQHFKILTGKGKEVTVNGITADAVSSLYPNPAGMGADRVVEILDTLPYIGYARYGKTGYINVPSFLTHNDKQFYAFSAMIDSVFKLVKKDGVEHLFIDVSKNSGGNSSVGDVLINYFYSKPYRTYQCNWRRSDEYLNLITKWGFKDSVYASKKPGSVLHFDSGTANPSNDNPNRFNGRAYIIIGNGTFSSAMMFGTIIKDNHIATLIGQTPQNGHPDHFGELYNSELPNTKLQFRFGVKEWIRPAGKLKDNYLRPDMEIDPEKYSNVEQMIEAVKN
jgi:hypothetical protein